MEYVSIDVKFLVNMMKKNDSMFNGLLKHATKELLEMFITSIKTELSSQMMSEDDADTLYLLQLIITNTYNTIR